MGLDSIMHHVNCSERTQPCTFEWIECSSLDIKLFFFFGHFLYDWMVALNGLEEYLNICILNHVCSFLSILPTYMRSEEK